MCDLSSGPVYDDVDSGFAPAWDAFPSELGNAITLKVNSTRLVDVPLMPDITLPFDSLYKIGLDLRHFAFFPFLSDRLILISDSRGQLTSIVTTPPTGSLESPLIQGAGTFFLKGENGTYIPYPLPVTTVPSSLASPPEQLMVDLTDAFFHSLIWAIEASGMIDRDVLPEDIPPSSPFQLNTGDIICLWQKYPDCWNFILHLRQSDHAVDRTGTFEIWQHPDGSCDFGKPLRRIFGCGHNFQIGSSGLD